MFIVMPMSVEKTVTLPSDQLDVFPGMLIEALYFPAICHKVRSLLWQLSMS